MAHEQLPSSSNVVELDPIRRRRRLIDEAAKEAVLMHIAMVQGVDASEYETAFSAALHKIDNLNQNDTDEIFKKSAHILDELMSQGT